VTSLRVVVNSSAGLVSELPAPQPGGVASELPVFFFNSTPAAFDDAEGGCQRAGGHLAMYSDYLEQQLVEGWMVAGGFIIPSFSGGPHLAPALVWPGPGPGLA
jgi:hypothetical protein